MKKKILLLLSILLLTSCNPTYYKSVESVYPLSVSNYDIEVVDGNNNIIPFSTEISLVRFDVSDKFSSLRDLLNDTYQLLHCYFDNNYEYIINGNKINNLAAINKNYGSDEFLEIPFDLYDILNKSIELTKLSKGKFNITVGELSSLWDDKILSSDNYYNTLPSNEEINDALDNVVSYLDIDKVILLKEENSKYYVRFKGEQEKVSLTLGAIAKGYANDVMKAKLNDVKGYLNSGSSLVTFLSESISENWNLSLVNPLYQKKVKLKEDVSLYNPLEVIIHKKEAFSISTSGDYERFFVNDNKIYHHIIDLETGYPSNNFTSVSAISSRGTILDALTTSLMNMTLVEGEKFVKELEEKYDVDIETIYMKESDKKIIVSCSDSLKGKVEVITSNNPLISQIEYH